MQREALFTTRNLRREESETQFSRFDFSSPKLGKSLEAGTHGSRPLPPTGESAATVAKVVRDYLRQNI
jgi:hypothetical protein